MSYIIFTYDVSLLEENPLFRAAAVQSAESPQWTTKPRLLTVVDIYAMQHMILASRPDTAFVAV